MAIQIVRSDAARHAGDAIAARFDQIVVLTQPPAEAKPERLTGVTEISELGDAVRTATLVRCGGCGGDVSRFAQDVILGR